MSLEFGRFESEVNLIEFAKKYGYDRAPRESTPSTVVMTNRARAGMPPADEIVIAWAKGEDCWVYVHVHNPDDKGTIVDFLGRRAEGKHIDRYRSSAEVHAELVEASRADWLTRPSELKPIDLARLQVARRWQAVSADPQPGRDRYLEHCRIHPDTYRDPKFEGTWRRSAVGDVLFPHRDEHGITGYEVRNRDVEAFANPGTRAIWHSVPAPSERILVITESPIAAMSYHQLSAPAGTPFSKDLMRYASVGEGAMTPRQAELIEKALAQFPEQSVCVAAVGSHDRSNELWAQVTGIASRQPHHRFIRDSPQNARDWNEVLRRDRVLHLQANFDTQAFRQRAGIGRGR